MMRSAAWLLLIALAACGSSPKTEFYTLVPVAPTRTAPVDIKGPPIQVGRVDLPSILDRSALVIQGSDAHVIVSDRDRWAGPLDTLVRQALSDDLRSRLGTAAVLAAGDPAPAGKARQLLVVIERFSADSAGRVVLKADWTMGSGNPPRPGAIHHERIEENAGSTEAGSVTAAMSRALGRLADDIAQAA